jgi:hypothetical protein
MVPEACNPRDAKLGGRNPLAFSDLVETLNDFEVLFKSLWGL